MDGSSSPEDRGIFEEQLQHIVQSSVRHADPSIAEVVRGDLLAEQDAHSPVEGQSEDSFEGTRGEARREKTVRWKSRSRDRYGNSGSQHESHTRKR